MTWGWLGTTTLLLGLGGCPGDDGNGDDGSMASTGSSPATGTTMSSEDATGTSSGGAASSSSGAVADSSSGGGESSSSGGGPLCDPQVPGEFNACIDRSGGVDNSLCNWMGLPDTTGFIGCLSSSTLEGGNVCMISGCEDACDCFAPPATGTAEVTCAAVLADGGNACVLDCSGGATCPDGMECAGDLCFWPPA